MKNIIKRTLAITLAFALSFTFIPALTDGLDAHAVAKPAKVTKLKYEGSGQTVKLTWSKVKKNLNGYTIYRNGKAIKSVGKKVLTFKEKGLAPGTTYSYYVRAYRNVKQKQWYNKKTGKWQKKKPAKKYRGKSKKVTVKLYGKASPTLKFTTAGEKPKSGTGEGFKIEAEAETEDGAIIVSWSSNNPAVKYNVLRDGVKIASLSGTSYTDRDVENGKSYIYTVQAVDENNNIKGSITLSPITARKESPRKISLSWSTYADTDSIKIYRDNTDQLVATLEGTANKYEYK